jgi:Glyoxalase-like domain
MASLLSRRFFLTLAGALVSPRMIPAAGSTPPSLDHILLGAGDLDAGVAEIEKESGVHAAGGGSHPGAGTRNALLSLGPERYLEIIAPDPQQNGAHSPRLSQLANLRQPQVVGWAVHTKDIEAVARRLREAKIPADGPNAGSRVRPDGKILHWRTLVLQDDVKGLLPFFIEWGGGTVHPSMDAPTGCTLASFTVETSEDALLRELFERMGIEVNVQQGRIGHLRARISGLHGEFEFFS